MSNSIDINLLARYQPLNALTSDHLQDLLKQIKLEKISAGNTLFNKGDSDSHQYFLTSGEIDLIGDSGVLKSIKSGTTEGFNAIAHILPRTVTAKAKIDGLFFKVDCELLDVMLTWDQTGSYQVSELNVGEHGGSEDWMSRILHTEAFHKIPPANIQALFMRMESIPVQAGEKIVSQGDTGDYFYTIKKGRALVTRSLPDQPKGIKLAELKDGDSFGEEALISNDKRNATITMLTNGILSRLSKKHFLDLLNEPLLNWVNYSQGEQLVRDGAHWLDVRLPAEHEANAISGDINIPLIFLRMKTDSLDNTKAYIVYCDTGRRSSAASFLLNERGFKTYVLSNGITSVPEDKRTEC